MANLKREFQKDDNNKSIPIQLTRVVSSASNTGDNIRQEIAESSPYTLKIIFPSQSSCMAFLIEQQGDLDKILDAKISPPGTESIVFNLEEDKSYSFFVVSKDYDDGYIDNEYRVIKDSTTNRKIITPTGENFPLETTFNLSIEDRMTLSVNDQDNEQWYNYTDSYQGGLVWQYSESINADFENKHLIYKLDMINHMIYLFEANGVLRLTEATEPWHATHLLKTLSDMFKFLTSSSVNSVFDRYPDLEDFKISLEEFFSNITNGEMGFDRTNTPYVDLFYWAEQRLFCDYFMGPNFGENLWITLNDWEDDSAEGPRQEFYDDVQRDVLLVNPENIKLEYGGYDAYQGLKALAWGDNPPGRSEDVAEMIWNYMFIREDGLYPSADRFFQGLNIPYNPIVSNVNGVGVPSNYYPQGDQNLRGYVFSIANSIIENIREYLEEEKEITENLINQLGEFIFNDQGMSGDFDPNLSAYRSKINVLDRALTSIRNFGISNGYVNLNQLHSGGDPEIGLDDLERANDSVETIKTQIESINTNVNLLPVVITNLQRARDYYTGMLMLMRTNDYLDENNYTFYLDSVTNLDFYSRVYDYYANLQVEEEGEEASQENVGPSLAYEAILQNVRFLKNMLDSINDNVWSSINGVNNVLIREIANISQTIKTSINTFSIINNTSAIVDGGDVVIRYAKVESGSITGWNPLPNEFVSLGNGLLLINLNDQVFRTPGKYMISVFPRSISFDDGVRISSDETTYGNNFLMLAPSSVMDEYQTDNYFKGWNLQIKDLNGNNVGDQKIITGYLYRESGPILKIHPFTNNQQGGNRVVIWSNEFEPILIDVDIVEHNNLTLSYGMYGRREFNRDAGLATIYDHNGNVYKQLSYGQYSNENTGGAVIEYRDPTPTSGSDG